MRILLLFLVAFLSTSVAAEESLSYYSANKASKRIHSMTSTTFLCGCSVNAESKINLDTCGYEPKEEVTVEGRRNHRAFRSELDHILSAYKLGKGLQCWGTEEERGQYPQCYDKHGNVVDGRSCCNRVDSRFKNAHNDLVNLAPIIGEINAAKSDKMAGEIKNGVRAYGMCDVEVSSTQWEPPSYRKGDVARIILYMHEKYGRDLNIKLTKEEIDQYYDWSDFDPVSNDEVKRNDAICYEQGFSNPLVSDCR